MKKDVGAAVLETDTWPQPRRIGAINWLGLWTLTRREIMRFMKIYTQSLLAPTVMTLLFYAVFALAMGGNGRMMGTLPFMTFVTPGLIIMSVAPNAFFNTAVSLVLSKLQGNIVDMLMPPLSALELTIGYTLGGVARGVAVGVLSIAALACVSDIVVLHRGYVIFHMVMGSMMLALIGLITGICSKDFDHLGAVQNFIVLPATFLSGTFYSINQLPGAWKLVCHLNPFFYMIDGFRYGFTGIADGSLYAGSWILVSVNLTMFLVAYILFATGYKLKS